MAVPESLLETIQKLQRLADRAGTPAEAANAAAKVQALLFKHNLTLAEVAAHEDQPTNDYVDHPFTLSAGSFHIGWHRRLVTTIAIHNFCRTIYTVGRSTVSIIGQPHNIAVVTHLYTYLARELTRQGLVQMRTHCASALPARQGSWVRAFCLAAVHEIYYRLAAQRARDEQASAASTALVLVTDAKLEQAMTQFHPGLRKGSPIAPGSDLMARALGREAGKRIALNKAVEADPLRKLPKGAQ
jgi:hypothetical protein